MSRRNGTHEDKTRKTRSGISGFDEITHGGLPRERITLVVGAPGCGKTIFGLAVLVEGARRGEPGIFVTFEENPAQLRRDAARFAWDLAKIDEKQLCFIDARLSDAVLHGGDFDLLGLLAAVGAEAKRLGAKRVVLDGLDVLLGELGDTARARREIFRLRAWCDEAKLTCVVTCKGDVRDGQTAPEHDFVQFVADCVVSLQHRVAQGAAMRTLRVAKYRGDAHSANELPFTITERGIEVAAATSAFLHHAVFDERVSTGVERLDTMLGGGYFRGSSVLISGAPGTSKTSLAASFAESACRRGEPTIYVSFDEAPDQIVRNVASIGIDLARHAKSRTLRMCSFRARSDNPELHVARIRAMLDEVRARNLVVDPISALTQTCDPYQADRAAVQLLDVAKSLGVTSVCTSLLANAAPLSEETPLGISTIADTWMHVSYVSKGGERNRALTIIKSRGTKHSNQVRELVLSDDGVTLADAYLSGGELLMGTLRWEKENADRRARDLAATEADLRQKQAEGALAETRARLEAARAELAMREAELARVLARTRADDESERSERAERSTRRGGDSTSTGSPRRAAASRTTR